MRAETVYYSPWLHAGLLGRQRPGGNRTEDDTATPLASTELAVHRAIYKQTLALAIVHAHPPHTVALSLVAKDIVPLDMEGSYLLSMVPVVGRELLLKHGAYAGEIAQDLKNSKIVAVYGHGSFAIGQLLEEAFQFTTTLEQSCHVIWLMRSLGTNRAFPETL